MLKVLKENDGDTITIRRMLKDIRKLYLKQFPKGDVYCGQENYLIFCEVRLDRTKFLDDLFYGMNFAIGFSDYIPEEGEGIPREEPRFRILFARFPEVKVKDEETDDEEKWSWFEIPLDGEYDNRVLTYDELMDYLDTFFADLRMTVFDLLFDDELYIGDYTKREVEDLLS